MKNYQFEEIVFWLSFIAFLLCWIGNIEPILTSIVGAIAVFNFVSAIYFANKN